MESLDANESRVLAVLRQTHDAQPVPVTATASCLTLEETSEIIRGLESKGLVELMHSAPDYSGLHATGQVHLVHYYSLTEAGVEASTHL